MIPAQHCKELHIGHRICCQESYEEMNVEKKDMSHAQLVILTRVGSHWFLVLGNLTLIMIAYGVSKLTGLQFCQF
jgi:hypothetical protein